MLKEVLNEVNKEVVKEQYQNQSNKNKKKACDHSQYITKLKNMEVRREKS